MASRIDSRLSSFLDRSVRAFEARVGPEATIVLVDSQPTLEEAARKADNRQLSFSASFVPSMKEELRQHDHLVVIAFRWAPAAEQVRRHLPLRFLMPESLRNSTRVTPTGVVISDVTVATNDPPCDGLSLLLYRARRSNKVQRLLASMQGIVDAANAAGDYGSAVSLLQAAIERLQILEELHDTEMVVAGKAADLGAIDAQAGSCYLAFTRQAPSGNGGERLWVKNGQLHRGSSIDASSPVSDGDFVLLRWGPRSTRESVRRHIENLRRTHQLRRDELIASSKSESYLSSVQKERERREKVVMDGLYGHHKMLPVVTPLALEAAGNLEAVVAVERDPATRFQTLLGEMRDHFWSVYGVRVPGLRVRINESDLPDGNYLVMIHEVPLVTGHLNVEKRFCLASLEQLKTVGIDGEPAVNPLEEGEGAWIGEESFEKAARHGFVVWQPAEYVAAHLKKLIRGNLCDFLTTNDLADALMDGGSTKSFDRLCIATGGLGRFRGVILALLGEELPAKPLNALAERYLELVDAPAFEISEELRCVDALKSHLLEDVSQWQVFLLAPDIADLIGQHIVRNADAAALALEPEAIQGALSAVRSAVSHSTKKTVIVVEDWRMRPFVRKLVEIEFPALRVVARREIGAAAPRLPEPAVTIALEQ